VKYVHTDKYFGGRFQTVPDRYVSLETPLRGITLSPLFIRVLFHYVLQWISFFPRNGNETAQMDWKGEWKGLVDEFWAPKTLQTPEDVIL
jgi:hypothetical protein